MQWYTRWNYFDRGSEGDRYVRARTWTNLALIVAAIVLVKGADRIANPGGGKYVAVAVSLFFAVWIATGFVRYMRCLDEMQRQIHFESFAIAWGLAMAATMPLAVLHIAFGWSFHPLYLVGFEIVRGATVNWLTWRRT